MNKNKLLVSADWLAQQLPSNKSIRIFDASYFLPSTKKDAYQEFLKLRIATANFADVDKQFAADNSDLPKDHQHLPHMFPLQQKFERECSKLGILPESHCIFYDQAGLFSSCRAWFIFAKLFGHKNVSILDGGLPIWLQKKYPVETEKDPVKQYPPSQYKAAQYDREAIVDLSQIKENLHTHGKLFTVLDARSADRFHARVDEPRPGLQRGHMPYSVNIPFDSLLNPDKTFKSPEQLQAYFEKVGIKPDVPVVTSCGSGLTASVISFALELAGVVKETDHRLYDGSWSEYGQVNLANKVWPKEKVQ